MFLCSFTWKFLLTILFVDAFLIMLNGYLMGLLKQKIDALLGSILVIILILMCIFSGWKSALVGLILTFIFGIIIRPVAALIAVKLLKTRF